MRYQQANNILIIDVLSSLGYQPVTQRNDTRNGLQYIYCSPFRDDANPSFVVTLNKNLYYDNGTGEGGNIKNLLAILSGSHRDDIKAALKFADRFNTGHTITKPTKIKSTGKKEKSILEVLEVKKLTSFALIIYLEKREITQEVAFKYCKEISYLNHNTNKKYFAIGFKSGSQSWEIRNEYFKGSLGLGKSITIINKDTSKILLFSGFIDFLSYLELKKTLTPTITTIVLNSDRFIKKAIEYINENNIQAVSFYKDNDESGNLCLIELQKTKANIIDQSINYSKHNDLNDYLMAQNKASV